MTSFIVVHLHTSLHTDSRHTLAFTFPQVYHVHMYSKNFCSLWSSPNHHIVHCNYTKRNDYTCGNMTRLKKCEAIRLRNAPSLWQTGTTHEPVAPRWIWTSLSADSLVNHMLGNMGNNKTRGMKRKWQGSKQQTFTMRIWFGWQYAFSFFNSFSKKGCTL